MEKNEREKMKNYRVHIYATCRIPVDVKADSPIEAVKRAEESVDLCSILNRDNCEYAEIQDYLVDELNENGEWVRSWELDPQDVY